mgnify:FL=1
MSYLISPRAAHRFVGYLEEEAVRFAPFEPFVRIADFPFAVRDLHSNHRRDEARSSP